MGLLLFLLNSTNPTTVGSSGILIIFGLIYVVAVCVVTVLFWFIAWVYGVLQSRKGGVARFRLSLLHSFYYSLVLALGVVIYIGTRSIGGGSFYEIVLIVVFMTVGCVYVERKTA